MISTQRMETECGKALHTIDTLEDIPSSLRDLLKARVVKIKDSASSYLDTVGSDGEAENFLVLAFQPIRNLSKPAEDTDFAEFPEFRMLMNSLERAQFKQLREKTWTLFQSRLTEAVILKNLSFLGANAN